MLNRRSRESIESQSHDENENHVPIRKYARPSFRDWEQKYCHGWLISIVFIVASLFRFTVCSSSRISRFIYIYVHRETSRIDGESMTLSDLIFSIVNRLNRSIQANMKWSSLTATPFATFDDGRKRLRATKRVCRRFYNVLLLSMERAQRAASRHDVCARFFFSIAHDNTSR